MNSSIISFEPDPDYGYEAEATLHSLVYGLEAQVQFWRAEALRLHAAAAECDSLHDRIDQLNTELDAAITDKHELAARWEQRMNEAQARHSAEIATVSRQLADARITAARNHASYQTARAERDRLQAQIQDGQGAIQADDESAEPITLPGTTRNDHVVINGNIVSAQPIAIVLPPAGNEPEPELPAGYEKVRGNAMVREGDLVYHAGKWQPPTRVAINKLRAGQYQMVARPHVDAQAEEQPAS